MALVLTKTASEIFDPIDAAGHARGARMDDCQRWGAELEAASVEMASSIDDPRFIGPVYFTGILTCPVIAADQNDYAPDAADPAAVFLLSSNAAHNITGIANPAAMPVPLDGRLLMLTNIGSFPITLKNNSTLSADAARFALDADLVLPGVGTGGVGATLIWCAGKWRRVA